MKILTTAIRLLLVSYLSLSLFQVSLAQHSVVRLGDEINSDEYDEICPVMSFNEEYLFFTKVGDPDFNKSLIDYGKELYDHKNLEAYNQKLKQIYSIIAGKNVEDPARSTYNQDVWYCNHNKGILGQPKHPGKPLNNALPNSICSNYDQNNTFVVINQFGEEGGMGAGFSTVQLQEDGTFTFPKPLEIQELYHNGPDVNLAMSTDAQMIVLAMQGKETYGDQDLYICIKVFDNVYAAPMHLNNAINSPYREATPFISQDKSKLYFASDRPGGKGGMDIYVSNRLDYSYKNWSEPVPLGAPINSEADDSHPYITLRGEDIYFSTNRDGSSDIYHAGLNRDTSLAGPIVVKITAIKEETGKPMPATISWGQAYNKGFDDFFNSRSGKYQYKFTENIPMKFQASNRGLNSEILVLDPQDLSRDSINEIEVVLSMTRDQSKIKVSRKTKPKPKEEKKELTGIEKELATKTKVVLKDIRFVRAKPDVVEESFPALEELAGVLARRPDLKIRVEGHTDNVGDPDALMELSQKRADAIRIILIQKGANSSQIETKGYGHTKPLNGNRNETEKQQNRRVEIKILEQRSYKK